MSQSPNPINLSPQRSSISTAFRIYKTRFVRYSWLSLLAGLWLLVPIYGWAKHCAIAGAISRQTFQKLLNQPESIAVAKSRTNSRLWHWLVAGIALTWLRWKLVGVVLFISFLAWLIIMMLTSVFFFSYITAERSAVVVFLLASLPALVVSIIALACALNLYARVWLAEPFLAVESLSVTDVFSQSWKSTKGVAKRISPKVCVVLTMLVVVTGIAVIPVHAGLGFIYELGRSLNTVYSERQLTEQSSDQMAQTLLLSCAIAQILLMPFAQVLKAVVCFDLQMQREL